MKKLENHKKNKKGKKKHNKTADEMMKKLRFERIAQTDTRVVYMKNVNGYISSIYIERICGAEIFKCADGEMTWIDAEEAGACLKKIEELGWCNEEDD